MRHSREPAHWTKTETIIKMRNILSQFPFGSNVADSILSIVVSVVVDLIIFVLFLILMMVSVRFTVHILILYYDHCRALNNELKWSLWCLNVRLASSKTYICIHIYWIQYITYNGTQFFQWWKIKWWTIVSIFRRFFRNIPIQYVEHWKMEGSVWLFVAWNSVMYFSSFFFPFFCVGFHLNTFEPATWTFLTRTCINSIRSFGVTDDFLHM